MDGLFLSGKTGEEEFRTTVSTLTNDLDDLETTFKTEMTKYAAHASGGREEQGEMGNKKIADKVQAAGAARFAAAKGFLEYLDKAAQAGQDQQAVQAGGELPAQEQDGERYKETSFEQLFQDKYRQLGDANEGNRTEEQKVNDRKAAADYAQRVMERRRWQRQNENIHNEEGQKQNDAPHVGQH